MMKLSILVCLLAVLGSVPAVANTEVEIGIANVFIPQNGYDDNDRVEAVLTGTFKSPCYTLGRSYADLSPDGSVFRVHQMAWKWPGFSCNVSELVLGDVPYLTTVLLGQLKAQTYKAEHLSLAGVKLVTQFQVAHATSPAVDSANYAIIRNVSIAPNFAVGTKVTAEIDGLLPGNCYDFGADPKVLIEGNVVVVLPSVQFEDFPNCTPSQIPFKKTIGIGSLSQGNYLIHVRSRGGNGVYQTFTVK